MNFPDYCIKIMKKIYFLLAGNFIKKNLVEIATGRLKSFLQRAKHVRQRTVRTVYEYDCIFIFIDISIILRHYRYL